MRTNLLFLFSDQHNFRVCGAYGNPANVTPNLDRLAKRGVTFDNCYTPSPICTPARMSMLTGRHPHRQDLWTNDGILASDLPTHAHSLGAAGYQPVLAGRLHSIGADQYHGYVRRLVGDHSPAWPGTSLTGMGILDRTNGPNRESLSKSGPGRSAYEMLDVATTSAAIEELDAYAMRREQGEDKPFAMTVGFMLPHAPYVASAEDFERFRGKIPPTIVPRPAAKDEHPWIREWRQLRQIEEVSESAIERARTAYYGLTYRLDYNIGKILDHLEAKNLADNTLIIYTSDHGDHVGERGLWWKHTFYEDSVRVPLILSMPGTLPENERRSAIVSLIDVCATMLDATNSDPLPNSDGRSFWDAARDGDLPFNGTAFSEYCTTDAQDFGGAYKQQRMVRKGNWKLNFYSGYQPELYDLLNDPNELNDLSSSSAHDDVKNELLDLVLKDWDAERVEEIMRRQTQNHSLLRKWAEQTQPADAIRWQYDK